MNTKRNSTKTLTCPECGDAFMVVGDEKIRLAFPRATQEQGPKPVKCPKHND